MIAAIDVFMIASTIFAILGLVITLSPKAQLYFVGWRGTVFNAVIILLLIVIIASIGLSNSTVKIID